MINLSFLALVCGYELGWHSGHKGRASMTWTMSSATLWGQALAKGRSKNKYLNIHSNVQKWKNPCGWDIPNLHSVAPSHRFNVSLHRQKFQGSSLSSNKVRNLYIFKLQVISVCEMCTRVCVHTWRRMLGEFYSRAALEQQSHKQTAALSRESAIRLCRTASVLQQAINTESIIAPRGATGQGGRERHHPKGQRLERKQEGPSMTEAGGCKWGRQGGGCELPRTKWSVKQELFVTRKLFTGGGCSIFHWTGECVSSKGHKLRKPLRFLV